MPTNEDTRRAFLHAKAQFRRKRLKELAVALVFGILFSAVLIGLIFLLNRPHRL